jgi:hypothetical protein
MLSGGFPSSARWNRSPARATLLALIPALAVAGCNTHEKDVRSDPPLLVPWNRVGDIWLGKSRARVERQYGSEKHGFHVVQRYGDAVDGYYRLHGSRVFVTFYGNRVGQIRIVTPYYRTKSGFGVGSIIRSGPCHRPTSLATRPCEHRWHGFVFNAWWKEKPCGCWTKVGLGPKSLTATVDNYMKPWFNIYVDHGRVTAFYFDSKFVD